MGNFNREKSRGNKRADLTVLRGAIENVSPVLKSTLRNAVPKEGGRNNNTGEETKHVNPFKLEKLSNIISNNISSVGDLRAITPYIDKAELIWSTILLHPNGKQDKTLTYDTQPSKVKNTALHNELLSIWDDYFTNDYKIDSDLTKMVNDVLWNTGSYVLFNLSRPGLDYLINGSEAESIQRVGGVESFKAAAQQSLAAEFVEVGGKVKARNKGVFIKDPNAAKSGPGIGSVGGLESLLGGTPRQTNEVEFNIFGGDLAQLADITFTDNLSVLLLQKISENKRASNVTDIMGVEDLGLSINSVLHSLDGKDKKKGKRPDKPDSTTQNISVDQMATLNREIYPNRNVVRQSLQFVKSNDSLSVQPYGRGLTWHVPSEAVIPIHFNGSNEHKMDYIFLLDEEGNFLKNTDDVNFYQSSKKNKASIANKPKTGSDNQMISSLRKIQEGRECDFDMTEFVEMAKDSIIRRFTASLISGKGNNMSITIDEETNKIFLSRLFRKQGVRCLYVPGEAVTYIALKYNGMGIGQSLTQSSKMHIARLAALDLADALANLEGAQPHSLLTITPEEHDSDPENTIAIARAAFFQNNPRLHSLLANAQLSVPQIVDALRESSLTVKVNSGENKHVVAPEMSLERVDKDNFKPVDDASRQQLLNQISNYFNLPKSWIDVSDEQNNFKIEAVTEFEMVNNQASLWQEKLCDGVIDFQKKHVRVNGPLLEELIRKISESKKLWVPDSKIDIEGGDEEKIKAILTDFIGNVYCELPTPVSVESTNKLTESIETVNKLVQAWEEMSGSKSIMENIVKLLGIDAEEFSADEIKENVKALFLTEAFKRYNLPMPFDDIINDGKGGGIASLVTNINAHNKNVSEFIAAYVLTKADGDKGIIKANKNKIAKKLAELAALMEEGGEQEEEENIGGPASEEGDTSEAVEDGEAVVDEEPVEEEVEEQEEETEEEETEETSEESEEDTPAGDVDVTDNDPEEDPFA